VFLPFRLLQIQENFCHELEETRSENIFLLSGYQAMKNINQMVS
jgi:hypothetical protein